MKNLILSAVLALAAFAAIPANAADQQYGPQTPALLTSQSVAASTTLDVSTNSDNPVIKLSPNTGMLLMFSQAATAATTAVTTSNVVYTLKGTLDQSFGWVTIGTFTYALNGTNTVLNATNIPASLFGNFRYAQLTTTQNAHTNTITVSAKAGFWH